MQKHFPKAIVNTFGIAQFNFLENRLFPRYLSKPAKGDRRKMLTEFTGSVKPGEMLFVLGRRGSGCSTFLRAAANRSALDVTGDLSFADMNAPDFGKLHRRETVYLP